MITFTFVFLRWRRSGLRETSNRVMTTHRMTIAAGARLIFILSASALLIPSTRFNTGAAVFERLQPLFFVAACSGLSVSLLFSQISLWTWLKRFFATRPRLPFIFYLLFFGSFLTFTLTTKIGILPGAPGVYENAVPLLLQQVLSVCVCLYLALMLLNQFRLMTPPRTVTFLLIWGIAAFAFCALPMKANFFAPGPYPPTYRFYPYSDAVFYDFSAATALEGLGFYRGDILLKPFSTWIIYLIRLVVGYDMNAIQLAQSALYGLLPAVLYLFADDLTGSFTGYLAAALAIVHELNAQSQTKILTIHSRLQMSEWLAEIIFITIVYLLVRLILKKTRHTGLTAAAIGALLGVGIYTRSNFFAFVPAILIWLIITMWQRRTALLRSLTVFIVTLILTMTPILVRSYQIKGEIFPEVFGSFFSVVMEQRIKPGLINDQEPEANTFTIGQSSEKLETSSSLSNLALRALAGQTVHAAAQTNTESTEYTADLPDVIEENTQNIILGEVIPKQSPSSTLPTVSGTAPEKEPLILAPIIKMTAEYALRNITAMFFVAPSEWRFTSLEDTIGDSDNAWRRNWDGNVDAGTIGLLTIEVVILAIACASLTKREKLSVPTILYMMSVYCVALGLSKTAGGRYIVPINWVPILLLSVGISELIRSFPGSQKFRNAFVRSEISDKNIFEGFENNSVRKSGNRWYIEKFALTGLTLFCLLSFWALVRIEKNSKPVKIDRPTATQLFHVKQTVDWVQVEEKINAGELTALTGTLLYPRFYYFNMGESGHDMAFKLKDYSRLVVRIFGKDGHGDFVLPLRASPDCIFDGQRMTAIGCWNRNVTYIDALALITHDEDGTVDQIWMREPMAEIACPVREPICPQIGDCY